MNYAILMLLLGANIWAYSWARKWHSMFTIGFITAVIMMGLVQDYLN